MNSVQQAAFNATLHHYGLSKLAVEAGELVPHVPLTHKVMNFLDPVFQAKDRAIAAGVAPVRDLVGHVGHGFSRPIEALKDLRAAYRSAPGVQLNLKNLGNVAGLAGLGYGTYRLGRAIKDRLDSPEYHGMHHGM